MRSPSPKSKIIAIVNDSPELIAAYTRQLVTHGYSVIPMVGGIEALEVLSKVQMVDLLLVDYSMPSMNGIEFLHELKKVQPSFFFRNRIVGFSSYPSDSPVAQQYAALGLEYTEKPDNEVDLLVSVAIHLNRRKAIA